MADGSTRRRFLAATGALGATALGGCLGGGDGGTPTGTAMDDMADSVTETAMDEAMTETTTDGGMTGTAFTVTVENVSTAETLGTMDGSTAVPLAPVAYVLHEEPGPLFEPGAAAGPGLERLAEDGSPAALVEVLEAAGFHPGVQALPKDAEEPGPIGPGGVYEFTVTAHEGQSLSLATMFVQSNDLFYAPGAAGIPLRADGEAVDGDLTDQLVLWDAGTEVNQAPGAGADQAPRQSSPNTGESEDGVVRAVAEVDDGFTYPDVSEVIELTVSSGGMDG